MRGVKYKKAFGYGENATGGNLEAVEVSTLEELASGLTVNGSVLVITEDIVFSEPLIVKGVENITILGKNGSVKLINLDQTKEKSGVLYFQDSKNIVIRNLTFIGPGAYDCDGYDLLCFDGVEDVWVDHCEFWDGIDENFSIKGISNRITVSWCKFGYKKEAKIDEEHEKDHRFSNLIGSRGDDKPLDGTYKITWAFCWWTDGCVSRMVRGRNASLHMLNCYWNSKDTKYCIGAENLDAYVEGCNFDVDVYNNKKIFRTEFGGLNGVRYVDTIAKYKKLREVTERVVIIPSYEYNKLSVDSVKSRITKEAGATLEF